MRAAVLIALLILAQNLDAKEPLGPEFRVNTSTVGNQGSAVSGAAGSPPAAVAVATRDDGGFVVVWNQQADGAQGVPGRVNAQLYGPGGTAEGAEFTIENGETSELDVAMAADGAFVVAWRDFISNHIEARRYTAAGQPAGTAFVVSDPASTQYPSAPCPRASYISVRVAIAADGAFVVLWTCAQGSVNFPSGSVFARYYDGDGIASDGYLSLGNFTTGSGFIGGLHADVLMTEGGYLVVYQGPCRIMPGSDTYSAPCGQRFNTLHAAQGNPIPLGQQRPFGQIGATRLAAARDAAGRFAVVWQRTLRDADGNEETRLATASFDAAASPISNEFAFPAGETLRNLPQIALSSTSSDTDYVVTYQRAIAGDPNGRSELVAREFALSGESPNGSFIAHANTSADHQFPAVAVDADRNYVLAWARVEDGQSDVYARRFGGAPPPPPAGELRLVVLDPSDPRIVVSEGNGSVVVTVERVNGSVGAASAQVQLFNNFSAGGEALLSTPDDISAVSSPATLNWADGEGGPKSVSFTIVDDAIDEHDEVATLSLESVTGASKGSPAALTLVVVDNDDPPAAAFTTASSSLSEGGPPVTITAALSAVSGKDITLAYTLSGTAQNELDYTVSPLSPLVLAAGETEAGITFTPVADDLEEPEESILVDLDIGSSLNVVAGTPTRHTVTLAASGGARTADLRAFIAPLQDGRRSGTQQDVILTISNFGPDAASGVSSRLALDSGRILNFPVFNNPVSCLRESGLDRIVNCTLSRPLAVNEVVEYRMTVQLGPPGEMNFQHRVQGGPGDPNLANNEARRSLTVLSSIIGFTGSSIEVEEGSNGLPNSFRVDATREGGIGAASVGYRVVAGGSATEGADFELVGATRLTFSESKTSDSFQVDIIDDSLPEGIEGFVLELFGPSNAELDPNRSRYTVVIIDNDGGPGDTRPDPFTLTHNGGETGTATAAPGSVVLTDFFKVSGIGGPASISVDSTAFGPTAVRKTAAEAPVAYSINDGAFTHAAGTVNNGDAVRLRVIAAQTPGDGVTATLTIGGVSDSFTVLTDAGSSTGGSGAGGDTGGSKGGGGAIGAPMLCALLLALWRRRRLSAGRGPA